MNVLLHQLHRTLRLATFAVVLVVCGSAASRCWASDAHATAEAHDEAGADDVSEESESGYRAIKLGEFKIRTSNSALSRKDSVTFILHATVKNEDYETFDHLYRQRKNKVRDQIVIATRLVPMEDYDDPELKKFRRRVLLRLRRSLPELPIDEVYISDFSLGVETT